MIERITGIVTHAGSGQRFFCITEQPVAGTVRNGTYQCDVSFPDWARNGAWTVTSVAARDYNGNTRTLTTADLQAAGWRTSVTVISPNPDVTPPTIGAFSFSPDTVAGNGVDSVVVSLSAYDARSYVQFIDMEFNNADGSRVARCSLSTTAEPSLTMRCVKRFTSADVGPWHVRYVRAVDAAGNARVLFTSDLQAVPYPTDLIVK